jgi:hypothetical protein
MTECLCTESAIVLGCDIHDAAMRPPARLSPDCRDGNHGKCDGLAWDLDLDETVPCECSRCLCGNQLA